MKNSITSLDSPARNAATARMARQPVVVPTVRQEEIDHLIWARPLEVPNLPSPTRQREVLRLPGKTRPLDAETARQDLSARSAEMAEEAVVVATSNPPPESVSVGGGPALCELEMVFSKAVKRNTTSRNSYK